MSTYPISISALFHRFGCFWVTVNYRIIAYRPTSSQCSLVDSRLFLFLDSRPKTILCYCVFLLLLVFFSFVVRCLLNTSLPVVIVS